MSQIDFDALRKSIAAVSGAVQSKTAELEALKRDRERISKAPGTREDVLDLALADVDSAASCYVERLRDDIAHNGNYRAEFCAGTRGEQLPVRFGVARRHHHKMGDAYDVEKAMAYLFKDQIKEGLRKAFAEMEWPHGAEPLKGRSERLSKLDAKIAAVQAELDAVRDEAAKTNLLV